MSISVDLLEVVESRLCENGVCHVELLPAINDDHGGVIVEMKEHMDSDTFVTRLRASMLKWKQQGKRGVWIKLPIGLVHLVETVVKEGFWYHHAEPSYLMLVHWIPKTPNTIPANATHRVGVGSIILNDKREVLTVQEKSGRFHGAGLWKIPTGVVDEGEDIFTAAVREVKEETGVDTEFVEVLGFRQSHKTFFGKSDLLFLCMMRPLSFDIETQELEIEAAQWMPFEEYAAQPSGQKNELFRYVNQVCLAKLGRGYGGFSPQPTISMFCDCAQPTYLYLNNKDLDKSRSAGNP
ncbi:NUDIX hydrolase domain - like 10 [Theobroma cacao]|uniref:Nudix hydrolase n=1 Tax=Theobroma cacao TaxID=3641 RepID=A0A061F5Q1_THECC|nr:Nudix hydrolase [Theobroma cacao]WRX29680.1 NUDIX hydrolase domain - like 10 [Theobroma cacao]